MRDKQRRKNERKAKWQKQLCQDLSAEVTVCVDLLQRICDTKFAAWKKDGVDRPQGEGKNKKSSTDMDVDGEGGDDDDDEEEDRVLTVFNGDKLEEVVAMYEELKAEIEKARKTCNDFKSKQELSPQAFNEIEKWGKRIDELEKELPNENDEAEAAAAAAAAKGKGKKAAKVPDAVVPANLLVASLLLHYKEKEGKTDDQLFSEVAAMQPGGQSSSSSSGGGKVSSYNLQEFFRVNMKYFAPGNVKKNLGFEITAPPAEQEPGSPGKDKKDGEPAEGSGSPKAAPSAASVMLQKLKEAFDEVDIPFGGSYEMPKPDPKAATAGGKGAMGAGMRPPGGFPTPTPVGALHSNPKGAGKAGAAPTQPDYTGGKKRSALSNELFSALHRKMFVHEVPAGQQSALCFTPNLEDDDDPNTFDQLELGSILEMAGPLQYKPIKVEDPAAVEAGGEPQVDKSTLRLKVRILNAAGEADAVGFVTYFAQGSVQLQELTIMRAVMETVLTNKAELKGIKIIRRIKSGEFLRVLHPAANMKPMARVYAM